MPHAKNELFLSRMNFAHLWVVVFTENHGSHLHNLLPLKIGLMHHEVELPEYDFCIVAKEPQMA